MCLFFATVNINAFIHSCLPSTHSMDVSFAPPSSVFHSSVGSPFSISPGDKYCPDLPPFHPRRTEKVSLPFLRCLVVCLENIICCLFGNKNDGSL